MKTRSFRKTLALRALLIPALAAACATENQRANLTALGTSAARPAAPRFGMPPSVTTAKAAAAPNAKTRIRWGRHAGNPPDFWVYFSPFPTTAPEKTRRSNELVERVYMTVGNNGQTAGTHQYQVLLRVWQPSPPVGVACEVAFRMAPFVVAEQGSVKKVAAFEVVYRLRDVVPKGSKIKPGRYLMMAYFMEQAPTGEAPEDTYKANNQYPFPPPEELPVPFEVRSGADEIRCVRASGSVRLQLPIRGGPVGTGSPGGGSAPPPPATSQVSVTATPASPATAGNIAFTATVPGNPSGFTHKFVFHYHPAAAPYDAAQTGAQTITTVGQAAASWTPDPQPVPGSLAVGLNVETRRTSNNELVGTGSSQITNYAVVSDPAHPFGWYFPITTQNTTEPVGSKISNADHAIAGNSVNVITGDPGVRVRANNTSCAQCHGGWPGNTSFCSAVPGFLGNQGQHAGDVILKNLFNDWKGRNCPS